MFDDLKEWLFSFIKSRNFVLTVIFIGCFGALLFRVFYLQIVKGAEYQETFALKLEREVTTASTRGKIYDRNGKVLAYSELSYSVAIEDNGTYETTKEKQHSLNDTIYRLIQLIEKNGDESIYDFGIIYEDGRYQFVNEGTRLLRFKADVYGHTRINQLETEEELATPDEIMDYMCGEKRYRIDEGEYDKEDRLKILNVRFAMSSNSYKRYVKTIVASNVSEKTVAAVLENVNDLQGVSIEEDSMRIYPDAKYFAPLIGWIGKASDEEIDLSDSYNKMEKDINNVLDENKIITLNNESKVNMKPRFRMTCLYSIAQTLGYLVCGTGNLCEQMVGYTTKWGDSASDFNPIANFTVDEVLQIGKYLGLPSKIIEKAPADGLGGLTDEEKLGVTYKQIAEYIEWGIFAFFKIFIFQF